MEPIRFYTTYIQCDKANVSAARYQDGSIALKITAAESDPSGGYYAGEPLTTATVCLADYGQKPKDGHVFIKNYSENQGTLNALVLAGVVSRPVRWIDAGHAKNGVAECQLLVEVG